MIQKYEVPEFLKNSVVHIVKTVSTIFCYIKYCASPTAGGPGELYKNERKESIFRLTVACLRSRDEANRAERPTWVERRAAAPRNPEVH